MTEREWLQAADPRPMLDFLRRKASERKLRLFAVACCRRIWHLLSDERSRWAVEVSERFADGRATKKEWRRAALGAMAVTEGMSGAASSAAKARSSAASAAFNATFKKDAAFYAALSAASATFHLIVNAMALERNLQADLLRCIVGNPFRPVTLDPSWMTWHGGLLVSIARRMYDSRDFTDMPVLADALEEAGCVSADILTHCRQPGEHVRGCWVVDLLLNKS